MIAVFALVVLFGQGVSDRPSDSGPPPLSGAVGFSDQVGWWSFEVSPAGLLRVSPVAEQPIQRQLTTSERNTLRDLVAKLPDKKAEYKFGTTETQFTETYFLDVGSGAGRRTYTVAAGLKNERGNPDVLSLVQTWVFVRSLFSSPRAIDPRRAYDDFTKDAK